MNSSTIDILVPSAFPDHYTTVQTTELTYTMTVAEHQTFQQTNTIPVHLNPQPCTLQHTLDHTCLPCTRNHYDAHHNCDLQHLADHTCPPAPTCNRQHLDDHTCPRLPQTQTTVEIPCNQTHFNPLFHQRIPLVLPPALICQRDHLDHHQCAPTPCLLTHYQPQCQEPHLRDHICVQTRPTATPDFELPTETLIRILESRVQKPTCNPTSGDFMYQSDEHSAFYEAFTSAISCTQFFDDDCTTPQPTPSLVPTPTTPALAHYIDASTSIDFSLSYPPAETVHSELTTDSEILALVEHPAQMLNPLRKVEAYLATTQPSLPTLSEYSAYSPSVTESDNHASLPPVAEMRTVHPFPSTSLLPPRLDMELNIPSENPDSPFFIRPSTHHTPSAFSSLKAPHSRDSPALPGPSSPFGRLNLNVQQEAELPPRPFLNLRHRTTIDQLAPSPRQRSYDIICFECTHSFSSVSMSEKFCSELCERKHANAIRQPTTTYSSAPPWRFDNSKHARDPREGHYDHDT